MANGNLLIAGAIALTIVLVGLSIAYAISRANELSIAAPYTTVRASGIITTI